MNLPSETHCYLCGEPCEAVDHGRHLSCEQEENARISAWEACSLSEALIHPEFDELHGKAA